MTFPFDGYEVEARMRPAAEAYAFDLDRALSAVVALQAQIPDDALTAKTLGTERIGNGAVIGPNGLVLTIGYLITEAADVTLTLNDGRRVAAHALGADPVTGFGLVQALEPLGLPALPLGASRAPGGRRAGDHRRRRRPRPRRGGPCPHPDALRRLLGVPARRRDHDRAGPSALERRRPDRDGGRAPGRRLAEPPAAVAARR